MRHALPRSVAPRAWLALRSFAAPALVALAACVTGCSGDDAAPPPDPTPNELTKITVAHNYITTESELVVDTFDVAAEDDIEIDWSGVSVDIQGHAVDPVKDINDVSFIRVKRADSADVSELLNAGNLTKDDVDGDWEVLPTGGKTKAKLSEFKSISDDSALDPEEFFQIDPDLTYLIVFATGTKIGFGARTMLYLEPSTDSLETKVSALADSSSKLTFDVDLTTPKKLEMAAEGPWEIDWSAITTDNHGNELVKNAIDRVLIGFYAGKDVADLEAGFLDLDQKTVALGGPDRSWEIAVEKGTTAKLANAVPRGNEGAFTDFKTDEEGKWIIGAFCSLCQNPAPVVVTILDPQ
jgi:hypothetical protein